MNAVAANGGSLAASAVGGSPSVQACSFELDVQWILDIIDKISDFLRKVGEAVNIGFDIIGEVLSTLGTIADWFAWVPGIGKMAKDAIKSACDLAGDALETVFNIRAEIVQFCANALAPWEIRSAGRQINEQIVPQSQAFTDSLEPGKFSSNSTWKGKAAEKFRTNAQAQHSFATTLAQGTEDFGRTVEDMGEAGVKATLDFVKNFIKAAISLGKAIAKVWQVPVGTAVATKDVIQLVIAILNMVKVWVKAIMAIVKQVSEIKSAAEGAAPSSSWPAMAS